MQLVESPEFNEYIESLEFQEHKKRVLGMTLHLYSGQFEAAGCTLAGYLLHYSLTARGLISLFAEAYWVGAGVVYEVSVDDFETYAPKINAYYNLVLFDISKQFRSREKYSLRMSNSCRIEICDYGYFRRSMDIESFQNELQENGTLLNGFMLDDFSSITHSPRNMYEEKDFERTFDEFFYPDGRKVQTEMKIGDRILGCGDIFPEIASMVKDKLGGTYNRSTHCIVVK